MLGNGGLFGHGSFAGYGGLSQAASRIMHGSPPAATIPPPDTLPPPPPEGAFPLLLPAGRLPLSSPWRQRQGPAHHAHPSQPPRRYTHQSYCNGTCGGRCNPLQSAPPAAPQPPTEASHTPFPAERPMRESPVAAPAACNPPSARLPAGPDTSGQAEEILGSEQIPPGGGGGGAAAPSAEGEGGAPEGGGGGSSGEAAAVPEEWERRVAEAMERLRVNQEKHLAQPQFPPRPTELDMLRMAHPCVPVFELNVPPPSSLGVGDNRCIVTTRSPAGPNPSTPFGGDLRLPTADTHHPTSSSPGGRRRATTVAAAGGGGGRGGAHHHHSHPSSPESRARSRSVSFPRQRGGGGGTPLLGSPASHGIRSPVTPGSPDAAAGCGGAAAGGWAPEAPPVSCASSAVPQLPSQQPRGGSGGGDPPSDGGRMDGEPEAEYRRRVRQSAGSLRDTIAKLQGQLREAGGGGGAPATGSPPAAATAPLSAPPPRRPGGSGVPSAPSGGTSAAAATSGGQSHPSPGNNGSAAAFAVTAAATQPQWGGGGGGAPAEVRSLSGGGSEGGGGGGEVNANATPYYNHMANREAEIMDLRLPTERGRLPVERHSSPAVTHRLHWPVKRDIEERRRKWSCKEHASEFVKFCMEPSCSRMVCLECVNQYHVGHATITVPSEDELHGTLETLSDDLHQGETALLNAPNMMRKSFAARKLKQLPGGDAAPGTGSASPVVGDPTRSKNEVISAVYEPPSTLEDITRETSEAFESLDTKLDYLSGKLEATGATWRTCRRRVKPDKEFRHPTENPPLYGRGMTSISKEHRHLLSKVPTIG